MAESRLIVDFTKRCPAAAGGLTCVRPKGHGTMHFHKSKHTAYTAWWVYAPDMNNPLEMAGHAHYTGYNIQHDRALTMPEDEEDMS